MSDLLLSPHRSGLMAGWIFWLWLAHDPPTGRQKMGPLYTSQRTEGQLRKIGITPGWRDWYRFSLHRISRLMQSVP